jgi:hypothetical protein
MKTTKNSKSATFHTIKHLQNMNSEELFQNFDLLTNVTFQKKSKKEGQNNLEKRASVRRRLQNQLNRIDYIARKK